MSGKVLVAMSGGVDSSLAAALLQKQGFDVEGVTMKLAAGICCDIASAQAVCVHLRIPHRVALAWWSRSTRMTFVFGVAKAAAKFMAVVVLPEPPFRLMKATNCMGAA